MSITPIPLSSLKRDKVNSQYNSFVHDLYECAYLLRVKPLPRNKNLPQHSNVDIQLSCFHECFERYLLVLVCSNRSLLFLVRENGHPPHTTQLAWFKHPDKEIISICIDPLRGNSVLCACRDSTIFLVPALQIVNDMRDAKKTAATANSKDLLKMRLAKPLKGTISCTVWWHTLDDRHIGIIGTKQGELVFIDTCLQQEVIFTVVLEITIFYRD